MATQQFTSEQEQQLSTLNSLSKRQLKYLLVRVLARLDRQLSAQLSAIISEPCFRTLEASWRNLHSLLVLNVNARRVKVKVLDIDWLNLSKDLNQSAALQRSLIYRKTAPDELNTLGGEPFGILVVDHEVNIDQQGEETFDQLYTLELLGSLGEMLLSPVVLAAADDFFGSANADWLADINRIERIINGPDFNSWQQLRNKPLSRFLGLVMPSLQLRPGYHQLNIGFMFSEQQGDGLWGNAAFGFVTTAIREFERIGWFGFMKSRWQGKYQGALLNLPPDAGSGDESSQNNSHLQAPQPRVRLFGNIAQFYAQQGFIPLTRNPLSERYFYVDNRSLWHTENDNEQVIALLQTSLLCCRIGHCLKAKMRELIGSYHSVQECQEELQQWIEQYCSQVVSTDEAILTRYPLRMASITVTESEYISGRYITDVCLQPQYQFDSFNGAVVLNTRDGQEVFSPEDAPGEAMPEESIA
ncbi:type VI secretion system contractile sheath large subunit [Thalassomonas sp. RHCl1]|uniref:type VI secretion system contractile sheath domain-containing protein n=1 Tax=Thalassomonas sp. RHCl1 TaxID=2995320 RepID=UPI00248CC486|nr:type VI secretion system contractile sheath large subunit [Thalassomonas sp. RHCl1]